MLEARRDLDADFRRFYRLSPAEAMELSGPEYLALAWRVPAYDGVTAVRLQQWAKEHKEIEKASGRALQTDPVLAGLIEYSEGG